MSSTDHYDLCMSIHLPVAVEPFVENLISISPHRVPENWTVTFTWRSPSLTITGVEVAKPTDDRGRVRTLCNKHTPTCTLTLKHAHTHTHTRTCTHTQKVVVLTSFNHYQWEHLYLPTPSISKITTVAFCGSKITLEFCSSSNERLKTNSSSTSSKVSFRMGLMEMVSLKEVLSEPNFRGWRVKLS